MFTDRPKRAAEAMPTATFIKDWGIKGKSSFVADPPNAGLTSIVDGKLQIATVEHKQPHLDGTTLTFQTRVLKGALPASGGTTSVFIDSGCTPKFPEPC